MPRAQKVLKQVKKALQTIIRKKKVLLPFFIGILVILIPVIYLISRNSNKVKAEWLAGGWNYRRVIEITNNAGSELTDFQTEVSVDTASIISAGKMNADCSDVRFTLANNTIIDHWLDKDCNTADTRFWVKIPIVPATSTSVFIYYGNPDAQSTSSGANVFVFFDDFNDNDYSSTWETHNRSYNSVTNSMGTVESGGVQRIYGTTGYNTDSGNGLRTGTSYPTPLVLEMDRKSFSYTGQRAWGYLHLYKDDSNWVSFGGGTDYNNLPNRYGRVTMLNGSRAHNSNLGGVDDFGDHRFTLKHDGTNAIFSVDGTQINSLAASTLTAVKVGTASWTRAATDTMDAQFDNARIRKYASADPTSTTKEEQTSDEAPVAQWRFDEGYTSSEQQPQTKIEQQITILDREYGCKGCTDLPTDNSLGIIKWDGSKYSDETVYFEVVMKTGGGAGVTAELFTTSGTVVTNSTLTTGSWDTSYARYRTSVPITLTDGEEYTVRFTSGNGAVQNSKINSARLIVLQDSPTDTITATQTQIEMGDVETQLLSSATAIDYPKIYNYDQTQFSPAPSTYLEATIKGSTNPTIQQQINITNKTFSATGNTYPGTPDFSTGFIHWDADKYPNSKVYLEAVTSTNGWYAAYRLVSSAGGTAPGSDSGNLDGSLRRSITGPITLTDDTDYTIQVRNSSIYTTSLFSAKLLIIQTGDNAITTTTTPIEVGSNVVGFTNTSNAPLDAPKYYLYDQNQFSPTPEASGDVRFEATLRIADAADTAYAVLVNKTSGATVAEVSRTGATTWSLVSTTNVDGDADWDTTNDDEYEVQVRCADNNGSGCSGSIANAHILLDQYSASGITDLEVVYPQVITTVTGTGTSFATKGYFSGVNPEYNDTYPVSFASATLNYFYEADIKTTSGTAYAHLYNIENQGSIVTNIPMDAGQVTSTSTSYERKRSPDITDKFVYPAWDKAMTLDTALKTSASSGVTASVSNSSLIIQVSNLSTTGAPTAYVDLFNKTDNTVVSGSEISTTSKDWDLVRSNELALTTNKEYYVRTRSSIEGSPVYLANAKIIHDQTATSGVYTTETTYDWINTYATNTNGTYANSNFINYVQLNNNDYINGFNEYPIYFETTMRTTSGTGYAQLYESAAITNSELTTTSVNAYERLRSTYSVDAYLSERGANTYTQLRHSSTGPNTTLVTNSRLLLQNRRVIANITHDSMLLGAHGSINEATWKDFSNCKSVNCLNFDGLNDNVKVPPGKLQEFGAGDSFTITVWFRTSDYDGVLLSKYDATTGTDGGLKIYLENGRVIGAIDDDNSWTPDDTVTSSKTYNDNLWHEVSFVKSETDYIKLYIDGSLQETDNFLAATGSLSNTDDMFFGIDGDGVSNAFQGDLDTISIYRFAKNSTEVEDTFASASRGVAIGELNYGRITNKMKLHWKLNESSANTCDATNDACDSSGTGTHGAWMGNATPESGKFGKSITLDGVGDYVIANDTNALAGSYWADAAFSNRRIYRVTNGNATGLTDYAVPFTLTYTSGMQPDFDDLLFTNASGETLPYWIESKTDSDSAYVWVKIDELPVVGTTIYMYYGNPTASSTANGENVFPLFDDFSTDIGYSEVGPGNSTYSISNGVMTITETASGSGNDSGYLFGSNFAVVSGTQQLRASVNPTVLKELHGAYFCGNVSGYNTSGRFYKMAGTQSWGYAMEQGYTGSGLQIVYASLNDFSCTGDVTIMQDDDATAAAQIEVDFFLIRNLATVEPTMVPLDIQRKTSVTHPTITVSTWVYPETFDDSERVLITRGSAPSYDWLIALNNDSSGKLLLANGNGANQKVSTNSLNLNAWNHVAMVLEGQRTKLFINGEYDSEIVNAGLTLGVHQISVGAATDGSNGFDGRIDDVRIYNSALSYSEIKLLNQYTPGPVAHWKLDENSGDYTFDSSGNDNDSTTWTGDMTWTAGRYGSALSFDGTDDVVRFAETPHIDLGAVNDSYTVEAWFKTSASYDNNGVILCKNSNEATYPYCLYMVGSTNQVAFRFYGGAAGSVVSSATYNDGNWHYAVGVRDAVADKVYLYIDGILVGQATDDSTTSVANDSDVSIGNGWDSYTSRDFNGQIDDVRIYDYARSSTQITMDMNAGHPIPGSPVGSTIGEWKFDEGYGDTANNSSREGSVLNGNLAGSDGCPGDSNCPTWSNQGKFGKALYFDGGSAETQDDYVDAGSDTSIDNLEDMTFSAWIYPESLGEGGFGRIFQKMATTINGRGLYVYTNNSLSYYHGWTTSTNGYASWTTPNNSITLNQWNHVVVTYNKTSTSNDPVIYINGIQQSLTEVTPPSGTSGDDSSGTLLFGNRVNAGQYDRTFDGYLDAIKLYNVLLSAEQVKVLYNQGYTAQFGGTGTTSTGTPDQSGSREFCVPGDSTSCSAPIAHWKMDENEGYMLYDSSGNSHDATLAGSYWNAWTNGKYGTGVFFDGVTDVAGFTELSLTSNHTAEFWLNYQDTEDGVVLAYETPGTYLGYFDSTNIYYSTAMGEYVYVPHGMTINGEWNHFAVVRTGATTVDFYKNGLKLGTTQNIPVDRPLALSHIGAFGNMSFPIRATIDDIRLFDYARTPNQIAWDYNHGGPVVHYKFDECSGTTAYNSALNSNGEAAGVNGAINITSGGGGSQDSTGTCGSEATSEAWNNGTNGQLNSTMSFDGTNDYVNTSATVNLSGTNKITVSFWLNWDTYENNDDLAVESSTNFNSNAGAILIDPNAASGLFDVAIRGSGYRLESFTRPGDGQWHHYVIVFDASSTNGDITVYQDAKLVTTTVTTNTLNGPYNMGNYTWYLMSRAGSSLFGAGKMDDFRIYNYGLTQHQAQTLYNNDSAVSFE